MEATQIIEATQPTQPIEAVPPTEAVEATQHEATQPEAVPPTEAVKAIKPSEPSEPTETLAEAQDLDTIKQLVEICQKSGKATHTYTLNSIKYQKKIIWKNKTDHVSSRSSLALLLLTFFKQYQGDKTQLKSIFKSLVEVKFSFTDNKLSCKLFLSIDIGDRNSVRLLEDPSIFNSFESKILTNEKLLEILDIFDDQNFSNCDFRWGWREKILLIGISRDSSEKFFSTRYGIGKVGVFLNKLLGHIEKWSHFQQNRVQFLFLLFNNLDFSNCLFQEISNFCCHQKKAEKIKSRILTDGYYLEECPCESIIEIIDPNKRYWSTFPHTYRRLEKIIMTSSLNEITTLKSMLNQIPSIHYRAFAEKIIQSSIHNLQKLVC